MTKNTSKEVRANEQAKETTIPIENIIAMVGLTSKEKDLHGDERLARMAELQGVIDIVVKDYNKNMARADFNKAAGKLEIVEELCGRYNYHSKNGLYQKHYKSEEPMKAITLDYEFEAIVPKVNQAKDGEPQYMEIVERMKHINLQDYDRYGKGLAYNQQWFSHVERLNCHMTARKHYLIFGTFGDVIFRFKQSDHAAGYFNGQSWLDFIQDCKSGKAWNSEELIKEIQRTYDAIYGPDVIKASQAHANFLEIASGGGGNSPITVRQTTNKKLVEYIMGAAREYLDDAVSFELAYKAKDDNK